MRSFDYPVKVYYLHTVFDDCFEVFAMDLQDAFETLLENEPTLHLNDIVSAVEHKCPGPNETIH